MQDKLSPASRAHRLFRHFTLAGLSRILKPGLVEDAAREFGSPTLRKRALTLPVMVWLGLHMALGQNRSPALPAPSQPGSRDGWRAGRHRRGRAVLIEGARLGLERTPHPRDARQSRFRPLLNRHTRRHGGACR